MGLFFLLHISPNFLGPSQKIDTKPESSLGPSQNYEPNPLKNGRARAESEPEIWTYPKVEIMSLRSVALDW